MTNYLKPDHDRWETPEQLTLVAGETSEQPPPPPDGIPKQWLPGFIRWPIRVFLLPFILLDIFANWLAKKIIRPPFREVGHCYQRGNCCFYVLMPEPRGLLGKAYFFWFTQVQGFYLREKKPIIEDGQFMMVMGCRYLQKDGRCGHYTLRPRVCRDWPIIEHFGPPKRLKGCGFKAEPREKRKD